MRLWTSVIKNFFFLRQKLSVKIILEERCLSTLFQTLYMNVEIFFLVEKKILVLDKTRNCSGHKRPLVSFLSVAAHHLSSFCICQIREEPDLESDP